MGNSRKSKNRRRKLNRTAEVRQARLQPSPTISNDKKGEKVFPKQAKGENASVSASANPKKAPTKSSANGSAKSKSEKNDFNVPKSDKLNISLIARVLKIFGRHYLKYWKTLTFAYACLFATVGLTMLAPWPLKLILDQIILQEPVPPEYSIIAPLMNIEPRQLLIWLCVAIVVMAFLKAVVSYFNKFFMSATGDRIQTDIRDRVFAHLQRLSLSFHESVRSGNMIFLLTSDVNKMKTIMIDMPQDVTHRVTSILLAAFLMFILDWQLCLMALASAPLIYLATTYFGRGMAKAMRRRREQEGEVAAVIAENVTSIELVQAYGREESEIKRFIRESRKSLRAMIKYLTAGRALSRVIDVFILGSTAAILYFGGLFALERQITPGVLVLMTVYVAEVKSAVEKFSEFIFKLIKAQASGERLLKLVENDMIVEDAPDAEAAPALRGKIEFEQVDFSYRKGNQVLDDLSFVVEPGETVALMGASGAGKSTIISLLMRFYDPQKGRIKIDGVDIRNFTLKSLRDQITVVMQEAKLFQQSVKDNIAFGRVGANDDDVFEAARLAEAHEFIVKMQAGYDTMMEEGGENLSGGQKQRINIARAMIRDTPIIILDEPATGVDAFAEAKINAAMEKLTRDKTTFIIAHNFSTIAHADKIMFLEAGRIAGMGTHKTLMKTSDAYKKLYEAQFGWQKSLNDDGMKNGRASMKKLDTAKSA